MKEHKHKYSEHHRHLMKDAHGESVLGYSYKVGKKLDTAITSKKEAEHLAFGYDKKRKPSPSFG